jgi:hypothetical protein
MKMFDKKDKDRHPAKTTADYTSLFLRKKELQKGSNSLIEF